MEAILSMTNAPDAFVPIARFDKGEADKIFDEVRQRGCKVVVQNDIPTCVMLAPERYEAIMEMIENEYLLSLAEERLKNDSGCVFTADEVYAELMPGDTDEMPAEYGVDFA
ncbi:MAG: type II toxin-antitoxin system Phd/YefM family antitoxin [Defluviitaleaceae bacterium]|nr:type II toxin-antitoxin system Phd/YefM family antitoxin [Defluviitaleaceae bacterium]